MRQMTWRAPDEVMERVRRQAAEHGRSLNDWVTAVLSAAADPETAGEEAAVLRERLARAGLLEAATTTTAVRPDRERVADARAAAGRGTSLSEHVREGRG